MKIEKIAYGILICTVVLISINSILLCRTVEDVTKAVTEGEERDTRIAEKEYTEIYDNFKKKESYIALTVNHGDLTSIEDAFAELIGAAKADDTDSLLIAKSRLIDALGHLKRLSGINIDSIL